MYFAISVPIGSPTGARSGSTARRAIVRHPLLQHLPMVLETPVEDNDGYAREIALLRDMAS